MLQRAGSDVWRVGFNAGDRAFWRDADSYIPFRGHLSEWDTFFFNILVSRNISDLVLYGDTRPVHAMAIEQARKLCLRIHVFEEGYLRPYWVTYERDGSNGHSPLMSLSLSEINARHHHSKSPPSAVPATWGDMRQHIFYGALYHWFVLSRGRHYPNFKPHRHLTVRQEFRLYIRKMALMPLTTMRRIWASWRVRTGGFPYHLVLLQLEHDASFLHHAPFDTMSEFLELAIQGFSKGAAPHQHLVFKAHPLEDGRAGFQSHIQRLARQFGVSNRVHFISGGKLAPLLDQAKSALTVNSTAGQQVLWRGLPLKAMGQAVYSRPEFISDQPIAEFFQNPTPPDKEAYLIYRQFLLETSQIPGGYYSSKGRKQLLRNVSDKILSDSDPYDIAPSRDQVRQDKLQLIV